MSQLAVFPNPSTTAPAGGATAANQVLEIAQLTAISGQLPSALGQTTMAGSLAVTIASNQSALAITAASLPLPTGASTEATLSAMSGKLPATLGQKTMANSMAVVLSSDQSSIPVTLSSTTITGTVAATQSGTWTVQPGNTANSTPWLVTDSSDGTVAAGTAAAKSSLAGLVYNSAAPTLTTGQQVAMQGDSSGNLLVNLKTAIPAGANVIGAVTQSGTWNIGSITTLPALVAGSAIIGKVGIDQTTPGTTNLVSAGQNGTWNITNVSGTVSLPTGAATSALQTTISGQLPASLGQKTMANSMAVVIASDQSSVPTKSGGSTVVNKSRNDYTSTNVTTSAYVQLVASTAAAISAIEIFDSSGQTLVLATGGAGSEVDQMYILPGGNGRIPFTIAASTRVSIKAVSGTASVGESTINYYSA